MPATAVINWFLSDTTNVLTSPLEGLEPAICVQVAR